MEAVIGLLALIGGLAAINWAIHVLFDWIPKLARRGRDRPGGGAKPRQHHPRPDGHPTNPTAPSRSRPRPSRRNHRARTPT